MFFCKMRDHTGGAHLLREPRAIWSWLGFINETALFSAARRHDYGPTSVNVRVGFLSHLVDNIPVLFAMLTTEPDANSCQ